MNLKKLILNLLYLIIVSVIAFLIIGFLFDQNDSVVDGDDSWGFPFVYYTYSGGKMSIEPVTRTYFSQLYLIIDWLVAILIAVGLIYGFKRLISLSKK
jgi:hypothetical protein